MRSCKSPLHAHPNFYLLTLFHILSPDYLSLVLLVLVVLVLVVLVLVLVLVRVLVVLLVLVRVLVVLLVLVIRVRVRVLLPLYRTFIAPLLSFFLFSALFFLFCVLLYRYTGLGHLQVSPNSRPLAFAG